MLGLGVLEPCQTSVKLQQQLLGEGADAAGVVLGDGAGYVGHGRIRLGRFLVEGRVVVLDQGVVLHRRVLEDLERLPGWPQPGGVQPVGVVPGAVLTVGGALHRLGERPLGLLAGGLLVDGQLGQRKRLEPLVGDRSALRTERP